MEILILGCGFTGRRVAERFLARGADVIATTRDPERLRDLGARVIRLDEVPVHLRQGALVVHSIPPEGSAGVVEMLGDAPARVVYLSTTGVYGGAQLVDENTSMDCGSERARARLAEEERVAAGRWSSLILRPAAIYGPGRGAHVSVRNGTYVAGDNLVSRIHVDDLATHVEAGLLSDVCGAYPVADEEPCTTREIAEFCAGLLGVSVVEVSGSRRTMGNRRVDGSAIRRALGIRLAYASYRVGIPACIAHVC